MKNSELQTYINQALAELNKTAYGRMILKNAQGQNFNITPDNIKLVEPGKRAGRCYKEINTEGRSEDKLTLSSEVFERNKQQPLTTEEDRIKGLAALLAHELTHAKQYNQNPEITPVDDLRQTPSSHKVPTLQERIAGSSEDSILEADCRTASFLIMQMNNPSETLQKYHQTTEQNSSFMAPDDFKRLSQTKPQLLQNFSAVRQKFARDSFRSILQNTSQTYPEFIAMMANRNGYNGTQLKKEGKLNLDFNLPNSLAALKAVYNPEIYGNLNLFLKTIPGLSSENKQKLAEELSVAVSRKNPQHSPLDELRGLTSSTPKNVTPTTLDLSKINSQKKTLTH